MTSLQLSDTPETDKRRIRCACLVLGDDLDFQRQVLGWMQMWIAQLKKTHKVTLLTRMLKEPKTRRITAKPRVINLKPHRQIERKRADSPGLAEWKINIQKQRNGTPNSTDKGFDLGQQEVLFVWSSVLHVVMQKATSATFFFHLVDKTTLPDDALSPLPHLLFPQNESNHSLGWGLARKQLFKSSLPP